MPDINFNFGTTVDSNNNSITLNSATGTWSNPTLGSFQFAARTPYGDSYTYKSNASPIAEYDRNPTQAKNRRLNQSTAYTSPIGPVFTGVKDAAWIQQWKDLQIASTYSTPAGPDLYGEAASATQAGLLYTNKTAGSVGGKLANFAIRGASTFLGIAAITPFSSKLLDQAGSLTATYATTPIESKNNKVFGVETPLLDFRARKFAIRNLTNDQNSIAGDIINVFDRRYDGASAGLRGSAFAAAIAASNLLTGPYTFFNLDTRYGWGQHDDPAAIRNDYTLRSSIAKSAGQAKNIYRKILAVTEAAIPFRGDRVNVIDFKKRTWNSIYQWVDSDIKLKEKGKENLDKFRKWSADAAATLGVNPYGTTKDFIKFFFTGPDLFAGGGDQSKDYALVFRAILTSFTDQFSPSWSPVNMIGRADPNYTYGGVSRDVDLAFTVYATDRDELRFIYRKLNALASYTAPEYNRSSKSLVAPWIRLTVGDLLVSQAAVINSLSYTFLDGDSTWEINFEEDPEMMQVPHKVDVSMGIHLVGNQLPEQLGSFYSLSKDFDENGTTIGKDSGRTWLYDTTTVTAANKSGALKQEAKDKLEQEKEKLAGILKNRGLNFRL